MATVADVFVLVLLLALVVRCVVVSSFAVRDEGTIGMCRTVIYLHPTQRNLLISETFVGKLSLCYLKLDCRGL